MAEMGGKVEGVIPRALMRREVKKPGEGEVSESGANKKEADGEVNGDGEGREEDMIGSIHVVESMHERKAYMAEHGDAFVALPGGFGTLDELVEIITWVSAPRDSNDETRRRCILRMGLTVGQSQIGIHAKPIVLYNVDGFWDKFLELVEVFIKSGMVDEETRGIMVEARTAEEVVKAVREYQIPGGRMELKWKERREVET